MDWLEHRIPPPVVLVVCLGTSQAVSYLLPHVTRGWLHGVVFLALVAAGVAVAYAGVLRIQRSGASLDPLHLDRGRALVTDGVFGFSRNPIYLGMALALCGQAVLLARPLFLLSPIFFALFITRFQIMPEERVLAAKFGAAYEDYRRRVRRWL